MRRWAHHLPLWILLFTIIWLLTHAHADAHAARDDARSATLGVSAVSGRLDMDEKCLAALQVCVDTNLVDSEKVAEHAKAITRLESWNAIFRAHIQPKPTNGRRK